MDKIAFIIPGFSESKKNNPAYDKIAGYFRQKGIKPIIVDIDWYHKTMTDYVCQFKEAYEKHKADFEIYFLGFSFGAMIAFLSSVELEPKAQILCSLSPYFKEDLPHIRKWWIKYIGLKRIDDFRSHSFDKLAGKVIAKTYILAGSKECKEVFRRAKAANQKIKDSTLTVVIDAKHQIGQSEYLETVKQTILGL